MDTAHTNRRHVLTSTLTLVFLIQTIENSSSSSIRTKGSSETNAEAPHDVTVDSLATDCDWSTFYTSVWGCQRELRPLKAQGYPWFAEVDANQSAVSANDTNRNLRDAGDPLDYVCRVLDRSRTCLEQHGIQGYCMDTALDRSIAKDFHFICHHERQDENLIPSLHCLHDKRVLAMLYFHIGNDCFHGMDILDDIMTRYKRAYFYILDVEQSWNFRKHLHLYCLPKHTITTCISQIVEDHCGTMSADLVQRYLFFLQDRFVQALKTAGLASDICTNEPLSVSDVPAAPLLSPPQEDLEFVRLVQMIAPGTALETLWGRYRVSTLQNLSGEKLCSPENAYNGYSACVLASDSKSERSKFNILQFAHGMTPLPYHGTQCNRLDQFTPCWNLLREICGTEVRKFALHATLLVMGCQIQTDLDTAGCPWQGMLLGHYMNASQATVWPLAIQGLYNPLTLDGINYRSNVSQDLETVISLLRPGVDEIARECGHHAARRLYVLLRTLPYLQSDAMKYELLMERTWPW